MVFFSSSFLGFSYSFFSFLKQEPPSVMALAASPLLYDRYLYEKGLFLSFFCIMFVCLWQLKN